jgi:hypothetical protein
VIVRVLEAAVLRKGWDMGEVHGVAGVHEPIDAPVPIIGRLHRNALEGLTEGRERREDSRQLVAESLLLADTIVVIDHDNHTVGAMQIDPSIVVHLNLLSVVSAPARLHDVPYTPVRSLRDDYRESFVGRPSRRCAQMTPDPFSEQRVPGWRTFSVCC